MKNYYQCNECKATFDTEEDVDGNFRCPNCFETGDFMISYVFKCINSDCGYTQYAYSVEFECPMCDSIKDAPITSSNKDKGAHYRYMYEGVKFDPYRVCKLFEIRGGPHEHMTKKVLRGSGKGHSKDDLIKELQCCLDRWKEMIEEESGEGASFNSPYRTSYQFKGIEFNDSIVCKVYEIKSFIQKKILTNLLYGSGKGGRYEEDLVEELQFLLDKWKKHA